VKRIAVFLVAPFALSLFSAAIWFGGPLIAIAGHAPLAGFWTRTLLIGSAWLIWIAVTTLGWWNRRKAQKALEAAILPDAETGDEKELAARMGDALATLRKASGGRNYLYDLPWYVIIGPPGAGKTTALVNSGLKFPLAGQAGGASYEGVGGTRYCDWWFAEDAVLVDTAGRYTLQDSDAKADNKSWLAFLNLLKQNRPKQPINGVLVAISIEDIMRLPDAELEAHAVAIRKRLLELHEQLKVDFPVYALFTKADLIAGFNEYFSAFPEVRRRQVWGATFQTSDRKLNSIDKVPAEFDALVERLTEETADRLQEEPDPMARIAIFGFPSQVAALKEPVARLLKTIFEPTRYHANAHLRGFYLTSGTQEGTPFDQMLGALGDSFASNLQSSMSGKGKSFFLRTLLTDVIFKEAGWVSRDLAAVRRSQIMRYGVMGLTAFVTAGLASAWLWSFNQNRALISAGDAAIAEYRSIGGKALNEDTVSDTKLHEVIDLLHKLRNMETGYANRGKEADWQETLGLSQRARLTEAGIEAYRDALERTLRSRLVLRLEEQMEANANNPEFLYEALKVYLMLGGKAPKVEDEFVVAWMMRDWEETLYPGAANAAGRAELESHLRAMLELDDARPPAIELNGALVASVQPMLVRLSLADRAYSLMRAEAAGSGLGAWTLVGAGGPDSALVFETIDGTPIEDVGVDGYFTYSGFHTVFLDQLGAVAEKLEAENWVLGEAGQQAGVEQQFTNLGRELLEKYRQDFIRQWETMFSKVRLRSMSGDKPQYLNLSAAASANSPLRNLVLAVSRETRLTVEPDGGAGPAEAVSEGGEPGIVEELARAAVKRAQDRATGWTRIGIDLAIRKSQTRLGTSGGGERALVPGEDIEADFRIFHQLADGADQSRPIDTLITNLYDIYRSLVLAATNPSQSQQVAANLQVQVVSLRASATRLPTPLRTMMESAISDFEGDAAGSAVAQLNQALNSEVTRVCQEVTANRYPFARDSGRDVQMTEFARLFAPNGVFDRFFATRLAEFVDMSGAEWAFKPDSNVAQEMSVATLREFQRAAEIRDAFFPAGSPMIGLNMVVRPNTISGNAEMVLMEVNGVVVQSAEVGNAPVNLTWPGTGAGSASITIYPELPDRDSTLSHTGPWAFMKLLRSGSISQSGDGISARFVIGGREVSYRIEVSSLRNPFVLPALDDFKCPAGL
jgi:type VI secretion system protein ImpL